LCQGEFQGLGAGLEEQFAELEFSLAKGALFVGDEAAGDGQDLVSEGLVEVGG
jgi:hypothetical protein